MRLPNRSSAPALLLIGALLAGCAGRDDPGPDAAAAPSTVDAGAGHAVGGHGGGLSGHPAAAAGAANAPAAPAAPASGVEAALRLEALIGQHSVLSSDMMRARIRADSDLAQVTNAALGRNTEALGAALEPGVGTAGQAQFERMWAEHVAELFEYSRGVASKDPQVTEQARKEIGEYEDELVGFLASESSGRLDRAAATAAIKEHSRHLLQAADAYAAKDYATAAQLYRRGYAHTFALGTTLARTLLPGDVAPAMETPAAKLRSSLTRLLGEHVALVIATMRSSVGDRADYSAMGTALDGNTADLAGAIDTLFGPAAAQQFQTLWADHVDALMAYTTAVVARDPARQDQAKRNLVAFEGRMSGFLSSATQNRLGQEALAAVFVMHDRVLLEEIDAFTAEDFQQATDLSYRVYDDMFAVSGQLASAIGATVAGRLPRGGSQTGGGGTAGAG